MTSGQREKRGQDYEYFQNDYSALEKGFVELYGDVCSKLFDETARKVYHIAFTTEPINFSCDDVPFRCNPCARDDVRYIAYILSLLSIMN